MSTKIYTAWRCRHRMFYLALDEIRKKAFEYAAKTVREEIKAFEPKVFEKAYKTFMKVKKQPDTPELRKLLQVRSAMAAAQIASTSMERMHPCDIDASLNVWLYNDHVYMIAYGECWNHVGNFVPSAAEDYAYWNNTDKPDHVTHQQWRQRGKTWDEVFGDAWDSARLVHKIIEAKDDTGLHELAKILLPKVDPYTVVP